MIKYATKCSTAGSPVFFFFFFWLSQNTGSHWKFYSQGRNLIVKMHFNIATNPVNQPDVRVFQGVQEGANEKARCWHLLRNYGDARRSARAQRGRT